MSNKVVVDTSLVVKWMLAEPDSDLAEKLLFDWIDKGTTLLAPPLLTYELTNVLYQHVRQGVVTLERAIAALSEVQYSLGLEIGAFFDLESGKRFLEQTGQLQLATTYDSPFLALAEHEQCELWTADQGLWNVLKTTYPWVRCLHEYRVGAFKSV